jgi:hypothetical protein
MKHWIARVRIGNAIGEREHVIRDEAEAELHRAAGWRVEGPFTPESDYRRDVKGLCAVMVRCAEKLESFGNEEPAGVASRLRDVANRFEREER